MASSRRDLIYRMTADPEGFKKGMAAAGQSTRGFWKELRKLEEQQRAVDEVMTAVGTGMVASGAAIGLGLGVAAKAAIDWESAWTGVAKVVDGSPEQMAALEAELRGLATTLPQTHEEIAGVAAAAGQLGIAREDITEFTQVMVAMGVSTNLASEEAATALARMMNIMQTAPSDVDRLASSIVGLGNTSATTEAEIVEMALRIAGAGQTVGMTESEVLGFAAALSSVGIEAESGGSSVSVAMVKISEFVNKGGESLETLAKVSGLSAKDFAAQWRTDPAAAIDLFVQGLGRMQQSGGDVFATLESLGMSEIRLRDSLLRLANAGSLLTDTLQTGNTAWDENTALMEEAARRYGTTEAQIQMTRNQLNDLGIDVGEQLLPAINNFLDAATGMMAWFQDLPAPAKAAITILGAGAAATLLLGGAALIAVPKIHEFNRTLLDMGSKRAAGVSRALTGITNVLTGPWGLAIGAGVVLLGSWIAKQAESRGRVEELSATLDEQTGAVTDNTRVWIVNKLQQDMIAEQARGLGLDINTVVDAVLGEQAAIDEVNRVLDEHRDGLDEAARGTVAVDTGTQTLIVDLNAFEEALLGTNGELDQARANHEEQQKVLEGTQDATSGVSAETQTLAERLEISTSAAVLAADGFASLDERVRALIDSAFALSGAQRDVEAGIDDLTDKLAENGATFDINTEAGRDNEAAVEALITDIATLAVTTAEQTGSAEEANEVLETQKERLHDVLTQAGFTEEQIQDYIGVLDGIPHEIQTIVEANVHINTTEQVNRIIVEEFGRTASTLVNEKGGVYYPAQNGLINAGIFQPAFPALYAFAEPQTGGEAFVPRLGDRSRSLGILSEAASWHRASVVPHEAGQRTINVNVTSYSDDFNTQQVLDDLALRGLV